MLRYVCTTLVWFVGLAPLASHSSEPDAEKPIVIAVLVDGLNDELLHSYALPNLKRLEEEGAYSHRLEPTFPAISGPTWVSLSTGCWPAKHGVVTDKFLDPVLGLMDHSSDPMWIRDCELIQQTAERQGIKTAALGWWGQWSESHGATATYISSNAEVEQQIPRDPTVFLSESERVAEIRRLLQLDAHPQLILAYFPGPDHAAHFEGIESKTVEIRLRALDQALGELTIIIDEHPNREQISLLVFSDHGAVPVHHIVNVRRILRRLNIEAQDIATGTTGFLYLADSEKRAEAVRSLSSYEEFDVYSKENLPNFAHLGGGPRVPDIILSAKPGYFTADPDLWPWYFQVLTIIGPDFLPSPLLGAGLVAAHGYGPDVPGNDAIFLAWGRGIDPGLNLGSTRMIDVHPTITNLLGISAGGEVDGIAIPVGGASR